MSQLQALQKLYVGDTQLQYSDVEFIIESFPQLTELAIDDLGLTGRFAFRKSRTSTTFGLSAISVFVFADAEKQRVRAALPDCKALYF
jgi:hypothetical protein